MSTATSAPQSLKSRVKQALQEHPAIWSRYWRAKQQIKRLSMLRYFLHDIRHTYRFMYWPWGQCEAWALSAELLFQYHKLEKGLVMPGKPRLFGLEPAASVMNLIDRWQRAGLPAKDPVFLGAIETLRCYLHRLEQLRLDPEKVMAPKVASFLQRFETVQAHAALSTPYQPTVPADIAPELLEYSFDALTHVRRSVREFKPTPVGAAILEHAVALAQLSPSACNRQPCNVILIDDPGKREAMLALQNGNKGFGHLAPHIAVITADERGFFDASERHEPYIDGGLFAMTFLLALRASGVGSCCLNWCVPPALDNAAHEVLGLSPAKRIIMLVAIGWPLENHVVPRSPRRATSDILTRI